MVLLPLAMNRPDLYQPAQALQALREDIQAEHTLIASRVTWYVTAQAFLLTAYATSWNAHFGWPVFFHTVMPVAAIVLSALILASIYAATWAQDVYLREQAALLERLQSDPELTPDAAERLALSVYERTTVGRRTDANGRVIGGRIHALVRIVPLALPFAFSALWAYALWAAP